MPIDRSRYPKNWKAIAFKIKQAADWHCEECGLDCSPALTALIENRSLRAKRTLTVHHQDYNPGNNEESNLIALCSGCHLKKHTNKRGNISAGQLNMFTHEQPAQKT